MAVIARAASSNIGIRANSILRCSGVRHHQREEVVIGARDVDTDAVFKVCQLGDRFVEGEFLEVIAVDEQMPAEIGWQTRVGIGDGFQHDTWMDQHDDRVLAALDDCLGSHYRI